MTIPNLMVNMQAHKLSSQFLKSFSTISQAFKLMEDDDVSLNPDDYNASQFYRAFAKYLKGATYCANNPTLYSKDFCYIRNIDGSNFYRGINNYYLDDGSIVLNDGTLLMFENTVKTVNTHLYISVDLNGKNSGPNMAGYDVFTFEFLDGKLLAMGAPETQYNDVDKYCNFAKISTTYAENMGIACAQKAKENPSEYFKWVVKNVK